MKRFLLNIISLVLCAALALALAGCGSGSNSFTWFVDEIPANLDPQVAASAEDIIACYNLYSGLVRRDPSGELVPELAESWTVSSDGLTYTFTIKSGLEYKAARGAATQYAITAEDFVFAFRRVFRAATASPYAAEFAAIENSAEVLAGSVPESALGVEASDDHTLVFHLSEADDNFLAKLTLPGAMPCDEQFFESTRSTYGLTSASTLSSGHFYIYNWTSSGLFLRRAAEGSLVDSLRLVQNTSAASQTAEQLILNERCSAALDETGAETSLRSVEYSDTTWCLLFNCDTVLASTELRQALASVALAAAEAPAGELYTAASGLVPSGLTVDGLDYRSAAGNAMPQLDDARELYMQARQSIDTSALGQVTLLVPADNAELEGVAEQINSQWQKELSLFFSVEQVTTEELAERLESGDYTIALAPVSTEGGSVYEMLHQFTASGGGLTGYSDTIYASRLAESAQQTGTARLTLLAECERQLLSDCAVVPLFEQQKRLLLADGVENLIFDAFGPVLDLTYTTKK